MSERAFELSWLGGAAEGRFRQARPEAATMPWGTLDPRAYPRELVARARLAWTQGAFSEYATAASLAQMMAALMRVGAPVDLIGMAGPFIGDEMLHAELNARMAMELGGAAPALADFDAMVPPVQTHDPFLAAVELAVRVCCVSEALSSPLLAATANAAAHPLTRAVLLQIARDEPPHALFGWLVLEWADGMLDDAARAHLARAAADQLEGAVAELRPLVPGASSVDRDAVRALGWLPTEDYLPLAQRVIDHDIRDRLAEYGIVVAPTALAA